MAIHIFLAAFSHPPRLVLQVARLHSFQKFELIVIHAIPFPHVRTQYDALESPDRPLTIIVTKPAVIHLTS
jgi:hypothetical protein